MWDCAIGMIGEILQRLFDAVLEDPSLNEKEKLQELAKKEIENLEN